MGVQGGEYINLNVHSRFRLVIDWLLQFEVYMGVIVLFGPVTLPHMTQHTPFYAKLEDVRSARAPAPVTGAFTFLPNHHPTSTTTSTTTFTPTLLLHYFLQSHGPMPHLL